MSKSNQNGQALAMFVIFVPVIIMVGTFIIDLSFAKYNSNKLNEITKDAIKYGLNHIDSNPYDDMTLLLKKNDSDINNLKIDIDSNNKIISIMVDKSTKGFFGSIVGEKIYKEKSSFKGYFNNEKITIERID